MSGFYHWHPCEYEGCKGYNTNGGYYCPTHNVGYDELKRMKRYSKLLRLLLDLEP